VLHAFVAFRCFVFQTPLTIINQLQTHPGVWGVATAPAARRNGYCRRAMAALLAAARADGQAFSTLYPFRESFYERLGYVTYPLTRIARSAPLVLLPAKETGSHSGADA
jgi:predicted acetyltransferase